MKHITTWRPDTCECELHYEWDDTQPEDQRVHTPVNEFIDVDGKIRRSKLCQYHMTEQMKQEAISKGERNLKNKELSDNSLVGNRFALVHEENKRKNDTLKTLGDAIPEMIEEVSNEDGSTGKRFKKGMEPSWRFDSERKLVVTLPVGVSKNKKNQTKIQIESSNERVIIQ